MAQQLHTNVVQQAESSIEVETLKDKEIHLNTDESESESGHLGSGGLTLSSPSQVSGNSLSSNPSPPQSQSEQTDFRETSRSKAPFRLATSHEEPRVKEALDDYYRFDPDYKQKGSRVTGLALPESDIDLVTTVPLEKIAEAFGDPTKESPLPKPMPRSISPYLSSEHDEEDATELKYLQRKMHTCLYLDRAKVPRIVLEHENGMRLDIIHASSDGYSQARDELMRCCAHFDERARLYLLKIKEFSKSFADIMDAKKHYPNSHIMSCIGIYVLQNLVKPVLPRLKKIYSRDGYVSFEMEDFAERSGRSLKNVEVLMDSVRTIPRDSCAEAMDEEAVPLYIEHGERYESVLEEAQSELDLYAQETYTVDKLFGIFLDLLPTRVRPGMVLDLFRPHIETETEWVQGAKFTFIEPVDKTEYHYNHERYHTIKQCCIHQAAKVLEERQHRSSSSMTMAVPDSRYDENEGDEEQEMYTSQYGMDGFEVQQQYVHEEVRYGVFEGYPMTNDGVNPPFYPRRRVFLGPHWDYFNPPYEFETRRQVGYFPPFHNNGTQYERYIPPFDPHHLPLIHGPVLPQGRMRRYDAGFSRREGRQEMQMYDEPPARPPPKNKPKGSKKRNKKNHRRENASRQRQIDRAERSDAEERKLDQVEVEREIQQRQKRLSNNDDASIVSGNEDHSTEEHGEEFLRREECKQENYQSEYDDYGEFYEPPEPRRRTSRRGQRDGRYFDTRMVNGREDVESSEYLHEPVGMGRGRQQRFVGHHNRKRGAAPPDAGLGYDFGGQNGDYYSGSKNYFPNQHHRRETSGRNRPYGRNKTRGHRSRFEYSRNSYGSNSSQYKKSSGRPKTRYVRKN